MALEDGFVGASTLGAAVALDGAFDTARLDGGHMVLVEQFLDAATLAVAQQATTVGVDPGGNDAGRLRGDVLGVCRPVPAP